MIEVERKVALNEEQLLRIETNAAFLEKATLTDTYFDSPDFRLSTNDIWLRERNCQFELKVGVKGIRGKVDRYLEVQTEMEILAQLGLEGHKEFSQALKEASFSPYATFQTIRRKYRWEKFTLDLDLTYFEDFVYRIAEIELMVPQEEQIPQAEKEINEFMQQFGLSPEQPARAKLIEYLFQKSPNHYQALVNAGVVVP